MSANPRHRAERRANESAPRPQALAAKVDHSTLGLVSLRGLESSRSPRHARKVDTTYAKYIGRIGALAVSLGVGVAVATTPGVAWAAPDSDADAPSSTSPDPESDAPKPSTPGSKTPAQTAPVDTPTDGSPSKGDTTPANDRVPKMKVDSSGGALTSTHHTTGETGSAPAETTPGTGAAQHAAEEQPTHGASDPVSDEGVIEETAPPAEVAPVEPVEPVALVEPVAPVEPVVELPVESVVNPPDPQNDSPQHTDLQTAGSDSQLDAIVDQLQIEPTDTGGSDLASAPSGAAAMRMSTMAVDDQPADPSNDAQLTTFSALQAPTAIPFNPLAAVLAIPGEVVNFASQFVAFVLTPFLVPAPSAPAQMPVLWAVLAWVRREITHTFFNRSPISNPVQISQSLTGEVTGDLNASDPNCDAPLTYTVTQQPAHGTVVVRPDGTYTYTPTSGTPTTTLTDSFTVVIDDSVGTQLPGIFGVIQGVVHGFAQLIGLAQPDTIVKQVGVTVAGTGVNLPPVVLPGGLVVTYQVGDSPVALAPSLSVLDGSAMLSSATVTVGLKTAGDVLSWTPPGDGSITSLLGYDPATGTLTLTGAATVAQYQAALQSVTFSSTAVGLFARSIVYGVIDDGGLSAVALPVVVTVLPNDLPVVTTSVLGNLLYSNNAAPKVVDPFVTISDNSTSLKRAVITVAGGLLGGNDTLAVNLPVVTHLTKAWDSTAGTLTLTGTASIAEYEAALQSVTFATSGGFLNLNLGLRTVSFVVTDIGDGSNLLPGTVLVLVGL